MLENIVFEILSKKKVKIEKNLNHDIKSTKKFISKKCVQNMDFIRNIGNIGSDKGSNQVSKSDALGAFYILCLIIEEISSGNCTYSYVSAKKLEADKNKFYNINGVFNDPNIRYFLKEHDFNNDFEKVHYKRLVDLWYELNQYDFKFNIKELQKSWEDLKVSMDSLFNTIAVNTYNQGNGLQTTDGNKKISRQLNKDCDFVYEKYKMLYDIVFEYLEI